MAFVCFGPSSKHFSLILQSGGVEKHQSVGRNKMRKQQHAQDGVARVNGGTERGVAKDQQMRESRALTSIRDEIVNEIRSDNDIRERELQVIAVGKSFDMVQKQLDTKLQLCNLVTDPARKTKLLSEIEEHLKEIDDLKISIGKLSNLSFVMATTNDQVHKSNDNATNEQVDESNDYAANEKVDESNGNAVDEE